MSNEDDLAAKVAKLEAELTALKAQLPKPAEPEKKREPWPRYDPTEGFRMPASAAQAMARVVPDVKSGGFDKTAWDRNKGPGEPGGFGPPNMHSGAKSVERGSGWENPRPLSGSVPGLRYIDQQLDVADAIDKGEAVKRALAAAIGKGSKP
jgi:hypothetical protein